MDISNWLRKKMIVRLENRNIRLKRNIEVAKKFIKDNNKWIKQYKNEL